jgi:hypothetical protein
MGCRAIDRVTGEDGILLHSFTAEAEEEDAYAEPFIKTLKQN